MLMTQVHTILNTIAGELLGEGVVVNEDLTNIIEIGNTFANVAGLDNYVKSLNDHVGRMVFKDHVYKGRAPSVMMDGWEFGSILEKISPDLPDATENESWDLVNGQTYDPNVFYKPSVSVSCWNKRVTFEVPVSITEKQVKSSFQSATQLNAFFSMIYNAIQNALTIRNDALIMRTINNFVVETIFADYGAAKLGTKSGVKAVNLLYLYNTEFTLTLTAVEAMTDTAFLKYAALIMGKYIDRMKVMSTLFNIGAKERFTPEDAIHVVMLSEFKKAADIYLQSDTFHNEMTALPAAESVPYWQGSGTTYAFTSTSKVDVKSSAGHTVATDGILCVMFDRDALGVTNLDPRVTTQYNAKAEFWNEYHKVDAGYFNDTNENFVVFFLSDVVA